METLAQHNDLPLGQEQVRLRVELKKSVAAATNFLAAPKAEINLCNVFSCLPRTSPSLAILSPLQDENGRPPGGFEANWFAIKI